MSFISCGSEYTTNGKGYFYQDGKRISESEWYERKYSWEAAQARLAHGTGATQHSVRVGCDAMSVNLTAGQRDVLLALAEDPMGDGRGTWCDTLTEYASEKLGRSPMSIGALISTICEKKLAVRDRTRRDCGDGKMRKCTAITLTELGEGVLSALRDSKEEK